MSETNSREMLLKKRCPLRHISTIVSLLISILLLTSSISLSIHAGEPVQRFSFLIEFTSPSLIQQLLFHSTRENTTFFTSIVPIILNNITLFQKNAIGKINQLIGLNLFEQNIKQYQLVFNGLWVQDLSEPVSRRIESLSFVKQVIRDERIVQTPLSSFSSLDTISFHEKEPLSLVSQPNCKHPHSGKNVSIAFFDTGIDYTHEALAKVYAGGYDFVNDNNDPFDDHGHGTHVIGIATAQPVLTITGHQFSGIAPNASVYAYKVLDEQGQGYTSWFLSAFEHALDPNQDGDISDRVDIISISAGIPKGSATDLISIAAKQAVHAGITVVAAAGNDGPDMNTISSPAIAREVIAVGASVQEEEIAAYSSRGRIDQSYIKPDIIAPGHQILSTWLNNEYKILSGTSMATPQVTGIIACFLEQNPSLNPSQIKSLLHAQATSLGYNTTTEGYGLITANKDYSALAPLNTSMSLDHVANQGIIAINLSIADVSSFVNYSVFLYPFDETNTINFLQVQHTTNTTYTHINIDARSFSTGFHVVQIDLSYNNSLTRLKQVISLQQHVSDNNQSRILFPHTIREAEEFTCSIKNHSSSAPKALFIFLVPLRTVQIRIGSTITFNAPLIRFSKHDEITGTILILIPGSPLHLEKNQIRIVKSGFD